jgi:hypothetical protein
MEDIGFQWSVLPYKKKANFCKLATYFRAQFPVLYIPYT